MFAGFADFAFYEMKLKGAHLVAGFGRIVDLKPADLLTDLTGAEALVDAEPEVIAHMNADHAETCRLYATKLLGAPDGEWRCVGCDPEGLDLQNGRMRPAAAVPAAGDDSPACCARCSSRWPSRRGRTARLRCPSLPTDGRAARRCGTLPSNQNTQIREGISCVVC